MDNLNSWFVMPKKLLLQVVDRLGPKSGYDSFLKNTVFLKFKNKIID